jgi:hypothetical protein
MVAELLETKTQPARTDATKSSVLNENSTPSEESTCTVSHQNERRALEASNDRCDISVLVAFLHSHLLIRNAVELFLIHQMLHCQFENSDIAFFSHSTISCTPRVAIFSGRNKAA